MKFSGGVPAGAFLGVSKGGHAPPRKKIFVAPSGPKNNVKCKN